MRPERFNAAEFASVSTRAARPASEPTMRAICSLETCSSASTLRTRTATSGNDGSSTLPLDTSLRELADERNAAAESLRHRRFFLHRRWNVVMMRLSARELQDLSSLMSCGGGGATPGRGPAPRCRCSGSTCMAAPIFTAWPGMPHTTLRGLVLRDRSGAGLHHFLEAARAVVAHAGEHHADGVRPDVLRPPSGTARRRSAGAG